MMYSAIPLHDKNEVCQLLSHNFVFEGDGFTITIPRANERVHLSIGWLRSNGSFD